MATTIDAKIVQDLREKTGAGMMDCKKALVESQGDIEKAIEILRLKGAATAEKKAGRVAKDGCVSLHISADEKSGLLFELNCETDFVTNTDQFQALVKDLLKQAVDKKFTSPEQFPQEPIKEAIAKMGEKISVGKIFKFDHSGAGLISSYLHAGNKPGISKLGVLVEASFQKDDTGKNEKAQGLLHDVALQIASMNPEFVSRTEIPKEVLDKEKEIYKEQAKQEGKPEKILDKIAEGKLAKYYSMVCLVDQAFIKDDKITVGQYVQNVSKEIGDEIKIVKFGRIKVGESK
jgi:elongation factor Ts